jgi:hypothetical protein
MVKGVMVLMKGVQIGTLYKLLGNVNLIGCNNIVSHEIDSNRRILNSTQLELNRFKPTRQDMIKSTQPGYGTRGWDTLEKKDFGICTTKVWLKGFLNVV